MIRAKARAALTVAVVCAVSFACEKNERGRPPAPTTTPAAAISPPPAASLAAPASTKASFTLDRHFAAVAPGGTQSFASSSPLVTWSVTEADGGSIDANGRYTAPSKSGTYHVVATASAGPSSSDTAAVTVGIFAPERVTLWNPGIVGGIPSRTIECTKVSAPFNDGATDATEAIQKSLDACAPGQVVSLAAGTYNTSASLEIRKGVVLRGAGSKETKIRASLKPGSVAAIYMWNRSPQYSAPAVAITADVPKDATVVPVASTSGFSAGDVIQIDQLDDTSYLFDGNDPYFKRPDYGPPSSAHRSLGQTTVVTSVRDNALVIADPIHLGFKLAFQPEVFKPTGPPPPPGSKDPPGVVKYAGLENLYVTGGQNSQIDIESCAYCWISGVESDGTTPAATTASNGVAGPGLGMTGAHVGIDRSYRVVVRDSYFHHATHVVQGGGAYGITLSRHTSESLIENDIVYYMNKPFTLRGSGGGNVIAYNYFDDAWTSADAALQETTLDLGHTSFPYMELVEGNYAPQIATENVWGNSGWMTIFRNQATSQQKRTPGSETYQIAAIAFEVMARNMNVVGNVLGATGMGGPQTGWRKIGLVYEVHGNPPGPGQAAVWRLGHGVGAGGGTDDIKTYEDPAQPHATAYELFRHANFDYVRNETVWDANVSVRTLPDSLYLGARPAFFAARTWPWVDPIGPTHVYVLPAKARFDACKGPSFC
jgi:hypothetical protein